MHEHEFLKGENKKRFFLVSCTCWHLPSIFQVFLYSNFLLLEWASDARWKEEKQRRLERKVFLESQRKMSLTLGRKGNFVCWQFKVFLALLRFQLFLLKLQFTRNMMGRRRNHFPSDVAFNARCSIQGEESTWERATELSSRRGASQGFAQWRLREWKTFLRSCCSPCKATEMFLRTQSLTHSIMQSHNINLHDFSSLFLSLASLEVVSWDCSLTIR